MKHINKPALLLSLLAVVIVALILYIRYNARPPDSTRTPATRTFVATAPLTPLLPAGKSDFRLELGPAELFVLGEKSLRRIPLRTDGPVTLQDLEWYYVFFHGDTVIGYNEKENRLYYQVAGTTVKTIALSRNNDNILLAGSEVLYDNMVRDLETDCLLLKYGTGYRFNLSRALAPHLRGVDSMCLLNYTEGMMADYNDTAFLFLPYRLNFLLLVHKDSATSYRLIPTIDPRPRIELKRVEVALPNGSRMISCAAEGGGSDMMNSAVSINRDGIFILTNEVHKVGEKYFDVVDVYDKATFAYRHSLRLENAGAGDFLLDIEASDEALYVLSKSRGVLKANLR